jgi:hypothetical protein
MVLQMENSSSLRREPNRLPTKLSILILDSRERKNKSGSLKTSRRPTTTLMCLRKVSSQLLRDQFSLETSSIQLKFQTTSSSNLMRKVLLPKNLSTDHQTPLLLHGPQSQKQLLHPPRLLVLTSQDRITEQTGATKDKFQQCILLSLMTD